MYTVRRKLMFGFWLVLAMIGALTVTSLSAILSYRDVVNDLDRNLNRVPQRRELIEPLATLFEPLQAIYPNTVQGCAARQQQFELRLSAVEQRTRDAWTKLAELPQDPELATTRELWQAGFWDIDQRLQELRRQQVHLTNPESSEKTAAWLLLRVGATQTVAISLPEFGTGLTGLLGSAREAYKASFVYVSLATLLVVLMFIGFTVAGYRWIFKPWDKLLDGTSRVAQGKFEYRVRLHTNDEFAELADSFNRMTDRFLEIREDLDHKARDLADQMMRQERLAGLGFLAAGIAHEINNPLTAIRWTSESMLGRLTALCREASPQDAALAENYLKMIQSEAVRCQQITAKLLDFARGGDGQRSRYDLTLIIHDVVKLVRAMTKYRRCEIVFDRTEPCTLEINGNEIKQVVLNLVANALDAMNDTDSVERQPRLQSTGPQVASTTVTLNGAASVVTTSDFAKRESVMPVRLDIRLTELIDHVELEFQDSGCGMTSEVLKNIFVPFYTTKATGHGTGLGLSISHRIVNDHGGRLCATSDGPGQGSTFRLSLPRVAAAQNDAA